MFQVEKENLYNAQRKSVMLPLYGERTIERRMFHGIALNWIEEISAGKAYTAQPFCSVSSICPVWTFEYKCLKIRKLCKCYNVKFLLAKSKPIERENQSEI